MQLKTWTVLLFSTLIFGSPIHAFWGTKEPWKTPATNDPKTDCSLVDMRIKEFAKINRRFTSLQDKQLQIALAITKSDGPDEGAKYLQTRELDELEKDRKEAAYYMHLAELNAAKHMGYSVQRLKQAWEWTGDGIQIKNYKRTPGETLKHRKLNVSSLKVRDFCYAIL